MKTKKKTSILITVFTMIVVVTTAGINMTADNVIEQTGPRPAPPPMPLQMWGQETPNSEAKTQLGLDRLSAPLNIPDGLELRSTRTLVSDDQTYRQMTQFYGHELTDVSDNALFNDFLDNGGVVIVYVEDDLAESFNWEDLGPSLVSEDAEKREMITINDANSLIVNGNRLQNEKSEVMFDIGNTRIGVISKNYDTTSLIPIAQTIRG